MDRLFTAEVLRNILWEEASNYEVIEDEIVDHSRWSVVHRLVFKELPTGKFYETNYSVGATENQDEGPFEDEDEVMCYEVEPYEETVIKYRTVVPF